MGPSRESGSHNLVPAMDYGGVTNGGDSLIDAESIGFLLFVPSRTEIQTERDYAVQIETGKTFLDETVHLSDEVYRNVVHHKRAFCMQPVALQIP